MILGYLTFSIPPEFYKTVFPLFKNKSNYHRKWKYFDEKEILISVIMSGFTKLKYNILKITLLLAHSWGVYNMETKGLAYLSKQ